MRALQVTIASHALAPSSEEETVVRLTRFVGIGCIALTVSACTDPLDDFGFYEERPIE